MNDRDTQKALRLAADALERKADKLAVKDAEAAERLWDRIIKLREQANRIPDRV